ncbi:class I fructose-bisphosphate aldolase [Vagococcus hydrophili]|uniref:fructose-bisphosphate aldolase n=1 Tax=Vagococcus hydrophili TaxID=2714947 RepID=A0A6G8AV94_9ENTE|nr:class I fructose-bisphosphate aldolase [Vagococcus hydrophili]QIL48988.1 fructose-bisphosphate aldolase class I [Vagococcus hydrophili]
MLDEKKLKIMQEKPGFIAALDESIRRTPSALRSYGIPDETYHTNQEMLDLIHDMRYRIMASSDFDSEHIIATILYKDTLKRTIQRVNTCEYLLEKKGIIPFLKIDQGQEPVMNGVQLMKEITDFDELMDLAKANKIFGTKSHSIILSANKMGIKEAVDQQFDLARKVLDNGLLPIIEPEVDIHSPEKEQSEAILKEELLGHLNQMNPDQKVILELSLPSIPDFYEELLSHPNVVRVVASSGGYKKAEADKKLSQNHGMIASFSRALEEGLAYQETDMEFDFALRESIQSIFDASIQ